MLFLIPVVLSLPGDWSHHWWGGGGKYLFLLPPPEAAYAGTKVFKLSRVSPEPCPGLDFDDDLDVVYPPRRYHSPPFGPPKDPAAPTYVLRLPGNHSEAMRVGVDSMMDALLSVRRLPGEF